jgi:hypothetical protein
MKVKKKVKTLDIQDGNDDNINTSLIEFHIRPQAS